MPPPPAHPPVCPRPRILWKSTGPAGEPDWKKIHDDQAVAAVQAGIRGCEPIPIPTLALLPYRPDLFLRIGPAALKHPELRATLFSHPACALTLVAGFYDETAPVLEPSLAGSGESIYHLLHWASLHGRKLGQPEGFYRETLIKDSYWGHRHARRTQNESLLADLAAWSGDERRNYAGAAAYFLMGRPGEPIGPYNDVLLSDPFYSYLALPRLAGRGFAVTPEAIGDDPKWSCHFALSRHSGRADDFLRAAANDPGWLVELAAGRGWLGDPAKRREILGILTGRADGHPLRGPARRFLGIPPSTEPLPARSQARPIPASLTLGQTAEARALSALSMAKNTDVWRPSPRQIHTPAFKTIVGPAHYTPRGLPRGTVVDSVQDGLAEIKSGRSVLDSTYQLRLQTYRSVIEDRPFKIYTNRPVDVEFGQWLSPWGVRIEPMPGPHP